MFAKRARIRVARLLLGLLLSTQAMVAFAFCDWTDRSAARAVALAASSEAPCHQAGQEMDASLCMMHCVAGSQTLDKPAFNVPALAAAPVLVVHSRVQWAAPRAAELPLPVAAPPPRILFRTLLI